MWERVPVAYFLVHPGLVLIGYSEMTDTEAFERRVSYFIRNSQEWGPCHTMQDHLRKPPSRSGGRRSEGNIWARAFSGFSMGKEWMRQDRQAEQFQEWTVNRFQQGLGYRSGP